jgi:hypothetical protein
MAPHYSVTVYVARWFVNSGTPTARRNMARLAPRNALHLNKGLSGGQGNHIRETLAGQLLHECG